MPRRPPPVRQHATSSSQPSRIRPSTGLRCGISTGRRADGDLGQPLRRTSGRIGKPDGAKARRTSNIGSSSLTIVASAAIIALWSPMPPDSLSLLDAPGLLYCWCCRLIPFHYCSRPDPTRSAHMYWVCSKFDFSLTLPFLDSDVLRVCVLRHLQVWQHELVQRCLPKIDLRLFLSQDRLISDSEVSLKIGSLHCSHYL